MVSTPCQVYSHIVVADLECHAVPPEILPPIKLMTGLLLDGDKVKLNTTSVADATASYNMVR